MNRVLNVLCEQLADARGAADRLLLDRFRASDGAAFAELVRRYGPVVWGACRRRLANLQDAEDAFQATFLVLIRRAPHLDAGVPLGPWLYRVAALTAGNVLRGNRRRAALAGPMGHEVPAAGADPSGAHLDLDAALLALPERDRAAVLLCHVQGLTRREAAERLGCPEGTLSARLSRALQRLRSRLGTGYPAVLAGAALAAPPGLAAAAVRAAGVYSTSTLTAAGVSPAVVGLTDGVLRMFWMKKVTTATVAAVLALGAGVLALGTAGRPANVARATEPPAGGAPPTKAAEADPLKRLEKRLADLEKQKQLLDATLEDIRAEKKKLEAAKKEKDDAAEAAALGRDIEVVLRDGWPYHVREVVNGRVAEMYCSNLDILTTYLARAHADPKGPKNLRVSAYKDHTMEDLRKVFAACATAGYTKASFGQTERPARYTTVARLYYRTDLIEVEAPPGPGEIDLKKFADPKKP